LILREIKRRSLLSVSISQLPTLEIGDAT